MRAAHTFPRSTACAISAAQDCHPNVWSISSSGNGSAVTPALCPNRSCPALSYAATRTPACTENRHCGPVPALPQPSPCSVARATQTAPAPATVPAHAPAPHKLHSPAPHEKPAPAAPARPHHPVCTNANARVHSASRQSGAHIAPRRCALLSPCLFLRALLRPAPRSSRSPPPGTGSMHQRLPYTADVVRWGSWNLEIADMDGWRSDPTSSSFHKWSQPKRLHVPFCRTEKSFWCSPPRYPNGTDPLQRR